MSVDGVEPTTYGSSKRNINSHIPEDKISYRNILKQTFEKLMNDTYLTKRILDSYLDADKMLTSFGLSHQHPSCTAYAMEVQ